MLTVVAREEDENDDVEQEQAEEAEEVEQEQEEAEEAEETEAVLSGMEVDVESTTPRPRVIYKSSKVTVALWLFCALEILK